MMTIFLKHYSNRGTLALIILGMALLLGACGGDSSKNATGDGKPGVKPVLVTGPVPDVTEADLNNVPDHEPFTFKQTPNRFYDVTVLPDGRVVGTGKMEASEIGRLFSATPEATGFNLLTPNGVSGGKFSYPRNTAIYLKDTSLFSIDSKVPVKISGNEVVEEFWLSASEEKVFFIANNINQEVLNEVTGNYDYIERNQLFMVDLATGTRVQLGANNPNSYVIYNDDRNSTFIHAARPRLLPDESRVVYVVSNESSGKIELRTVNINGSDDIVLHGDVVPGLGNVESVEDFSDIENIFVYTFSPDSSKIVYGVTSSSGMELFSVTPLGANNVKIVSVHATDDSAELNMLFVSQSKRSIDITADSLHLLFLGSKNELVLGGKNVTSTPALYSVQLAGTNLIKLSHDEEVSGFTLSSSPQSENVIYGANGIFSVPVSGGASTQLSNGISIYNINELMLADNDQAIIYTASDDLSTANIRLYMTKPDGSSTLNLSGLPSSNSGLKRLYKRETFMLSPMSEYVVYRTYLEQKQGEALYAIKLDGTDRVKVTPDTLNLRSKGAQMGGFFNKKFYFIYNKNNAFFSELYSFNLNDNAVTNMSAIWPAFVTEDALPFSWQQSVTGLVQSFQTSGSGFVDVALQVINTNAECRIAILENTFVNSGSENMIMESSGNYLYYTVRSSTKTGLYRISTDTCDVVTIDEGDVDRVARIKLSPDEANISYTAFADGGTNLFATAIDGTNTRLLSSADILGRVKSINQGAFSISPDSNRVIYWADQETAGIYELYSATMDGSVISKINGSLFPGGEVFTAIFSKFTPEISTDNKWVVYKAQQDSLEYQLYKSQLDGSENTLLSGDIVDSKIYFNNTFEVSKITQDGSKVVYLTRDNTSNSIGIHVTNLEGIPSSTKLTPTFQQGGGVAGRNSAYEFSLTSDSLAVVYFAQENSELPWEMFAVKLNGTGLVKLNSPTVSGRIISYRITGDNRSVVFFAKAGDTDVVGLYVSHLDGSGNILLQNNVSIRHNSRVKPVLTDDGHVVFRAIIGDVDGIYVKSLTGGAETLIFAVPEGRRIEAIFLTANNEITLFGDLRQFGVDEKFSFDLN